MSRQETLQTSENVRWPKRWLKWWIRLSANNQTPETSLSSFIYSRTSLPGLESTAIVTVMTLKWFSKTKERKLQSCVIKSLTENSLTSVSSSKVTMSESPQYKSTWTTRRKMAKKHLRTTSLMKLSPKVSTILSQWTASTIFGSTSCWHIHLLKTTFLRMIKPSCSTWRLSMLSSRLSSLWLWLWDLSSRPMNFSQTRILSTPYDSKKLAARMSP